MKITRPKRDDTKFRDLCVGDAFSSQSYQTMIFIKVAKTKESPTGIQRNAINTAQWDLYTFGDDSVVTLLESELTIK